jgi:hypothetical protein
MLPQQKSFPMKVQCGWCSASMGEKPGPVGTTSHGLCKNCATRLNGELDVLDVERTIEEAAHARRAA